MRKRIMTLILGLICLPVFCIGCKNGQNSQVEDTEETTEEILNTVIYIGQEDDYGEYYMPYTGELTPDQVIEGIADTTGWELSLDEEVTESDDGGYVICFSEDSVFYTGQTLDEEDEFYIPSEQDFYLTVLDSITMTLRADFQEEDETLNLYYRGAEDADLVLAGTGQILSKDTAYDREELENYTQRRYIGGETAQSYDLEVTFVKMQGDETVMLKVDDKTQVYSVTYTALKSVFKNSKEGREMKIQITEDTETGEKLITKIYY